MPAYVIAQIEVTDVEQFRKYLQENPRTIALYGGRYVVRGGEIVTLEGAAPANRLVVIEFPSLEKAKEWYNSPEYQKVKVLRDGAAHGSIIAVQGC